MKVDAWDTHDSLLKHSITTPVSSLCKIGSVAYVLVSDGALSQSHHVYIVVQFLQRKSRFGGRPVLGLVRVCIWTAILLFLLDIFKACAIISRFTMIAGEHFGMLIIVLFIQESIKGAVGKFEMPKWEDPNSLVYQFQWLYTNGLLSIIFSFGLLYTALKSRRA